MVLNSIKSSPYAGQNAIIWVRQSTKEQSDSSCNDQAAVIAAFAKHHGIAIIDRVTLDGVSGSSSKVGERIDEIIRRKQLRDDFDLLIVQDLSRLTRGGVVTGNHLQYRLAEAGIELLSVHDEHLGGDLGEIHATLKHMASQQQAKAIALAVTRGRTASIERGDTPSIARPPYGIDRLIVGKDGQARCILHLTADGVQLKMNPRTREVVGAFGKQDGRGAFRGARQHYRKQDDEIVVLVQGEPTHVAVIRKIFHCYDVEGWGYHRICKHLNEEGVPSPLGGPWAKSSLRNLLHNPLYIGLAATQTKVSGRYYARGGRGRSGVHSGDYSGGGPQKVERQLAETAGRRHLRRKARPLEEWRLERMPQFQGFLPRPTRTLARRRIFQHLRDKAQGKRGPRKEGARGKADSSFILTNRLRARHSGEVLSGRNTGKIGRCHTYYGITKARNRPGASANELDRKLIPAPPLHALIVGLLGETIRSIPQLKERVRRQAQARLSVVPTTDADGERGRLEVEAKDLADQLNFLAEHLDRFELKVAEKKLRELGDRYDAVQRKLSNNIGPRQPQTERDIDTAVDQALAELASAEDFVRTFGRPALDRLLDVLLSKAEVDMASRYLEIEFRLPLWALEAPERMCRGFSHAHRAAPKAYPLTVAQTGFLLYRGRFVCTKDGIVGLLAA